MRVRRAKDKITYLQKTIDSMKRGEKVTSETRFYPFDDTSEIMALLCRSTFGITAGCAELVTDDSSNDKDRVIDDIHTDMMTLVCTVDYLEHFANGFIDYAVPIVEKSLSDNWDEPREHGVILRSFAELLAASRKMSIADLLDPTRDRKDDDNEE